MFDNEKDLLDKIRFGEDWRFELKEVRFTGGKVTGPSRDGLADELAAFANAKGGVCLLGVTDEPREITGIPVDRLNAVVAFVREICTDSIKPTLNAGIQIVPLPSSTGERLPVVKIDVPRSLFVHQSPGGYLYRIGEAKRGMSPEYLARLFQHRSQARLIRFDEQIIADAGFEDLSPDLYARFRTSRSGDDLTDMLRKLHMVLTDEDGTTRPTVAGVLMASKDPRQWLPNAFIQAVAYRGTEIRADTDDPYQVDASDFTGPLDAQIAGACRFVAKNMKTAAIKDQGRVDIPQFDMTAVFEAVVNAAAHRDYSVYGSKIRLRLFADRLELHSPGALANTLDVEELPHLQAARNETLASLLAKCPVPENIPRLKTDRLTLMDRRGEGVRIVLENSKRLSGREPEYRMIGDAELMLTIYAADPREAAAAMRRKDAP